MRARRVRRRESSSHDDFFRSLSLMIFVCDDVFFIRTSSVVVHVFFLVCGKSFYDDVFRTTI